MMSNKRLATEYHEILSQKGIVEEGVLSRNYDVISKYPTNLDRTFLKQGNFEGTGLEEILDGASLNILRNILKRKR